MSKHRQYKAAINDVHKQLPGHHVLVSKIFHLRYVEFIFDILDKILLRTTPMLIGLSASVAVGLLLLLISVVFGYQIVSMSVLTYVFALGFIVGVVYEYIRRLLAK